MLRLYSCDMVCDFVNIYGEAYIKGTSQFVLFTK